jgi:hypothetical protein
MHLKSPAFCAFYRYSSYILIISLQCSTGWYSTASTANGPSLMRLSITPKLPEPVPCHQQRHLLQRLREPVKVLHMPIFETIEFGS